MRAPEYLRRQDGSDRRNTASRNGRAQTLRGQAVLDALRRMYRNARAFTVQSDGVVDPNVERISVCCYGDQQFSVCIGPETFRIVGLAGSARDSVITTLAQEIATDIERRPSLYAASPATSTTSSSR